MTQIVYTKDPNATLDYGFVWSDWLTAAGSDTISTSTWTADTGLTVNSSSTSGGTAIAWVTGGTVGVNYQLTNRIVTAGGRTDERTMIIQVRQR